MKKLKLFVVSFALMLSGFVYATNISTWNELKTYYGGAGSDGTLNILADINFEGELTEHPGWTTLIIRGWNASANKSAHRILDGYDHGELYVWTTFKIGDHKTAIFSDLTLKRFRGPAAIDTIDSFVTFNSTINFIDNTQVSISLFNSTATFSDSFVNFSSNNYVLVDADGSLISFNNSFINFTSTQTGTAIRAQTSSVSFNNSVINFVNNKSLVEGGAIYADGSTISFSNSTITFKNNFMRPNVKNDIYLEIYVDYLIQKEFEPEVVFNTNVYFLNGIRTTGTVV
ncbi:MAG: hypothetical protein LBT17_01780, partial [Mycoplasmataceae bacterium]|nr:hypothetical protein [Mycoplasmataceae bacterium]